MAGRGFGKGNPTIGVMCFTAYMYVYLCGGIHQRSTLIKSKCMVVLAHQPSKIIPCESCTTDLHVNHVHFSLHISTG